MEGVVSTLQVKLDDYVRRLQKNPKYSSIEIDILFSKGKSNDISILSNAGMWLPNSNMMNKEISDFIIKEYAALDKKVPLDINITLSKKQSNISSNELNSKMNDIEYALFLPEKPKYKLADVILPDETINSIKEAIATIESFEIVYNQWNFISKEPSAKTNICFYGAPGTGKTMCAHAIADSLGKEILIASYADSQSQYVGVGPKNLKNVFKVAEEKNALLFFDEADSFLRKRTSDNSSSASMHYNSMTNEMMKHLEDFNGIVIFATNLTENTDEAFKTRISFSIEFKVPDEHCRAKIIQKMIPEQVPLANSLTSEDYMELSQVCDGLVGRDIRNSVKTTLSVGAQNKQYPFTKEQFIAGFKKYKADKNSFDKNSGTKKTEKSNPMDIYTANGCIHNLLTYAAWIDGRENEIEAECLKLFSKILSRNKLLINSVDDLPEFEEICHELADEELKRKTMRYFAYFMAMTKQDDSLYNNLYEKLVKQLKIDNDFSTTLNNYYKQVKQLSLIREKLLN